MMLAGVAFFACKPETIVEIDPEIDVTPASITADYTSAIYDITVNANTSWVLSRTDAEGNEINWVKVDQLSGKGSCVMHFKVLENPTENERAAVMKFSAGPNGEAVAFVDVVQAANPDPVKDPEPDPEDPPVVDPDPVFFTLQFDFTRTDLGWPTAKTADWSQLKNPDSGLAGDNGGTATENTHRRAQVTYTIDGTGYDFTFVDPDGSTAHNIYLSLEKGVYSGTLRSFGLPAIPGKRLVKVVMVQNASTKDPSAFVRNVGITSQVYDVAAKPEDMTYIKGGEPQNQYTNLGEYTYELSDTEANTVYYVNSPTNASIIMSMTLSYEDTEGGDTPGPEPEDPAVKQLLFDFTGDPQAGWPVSKTESDYNNGGHEVDYVLDGVSYTFLLATCDVDAGHTNAPYWVPPTETAAGYLHTNAQYRYVGLPVIEGYVLSKVVLVGAGVSLHASNKPKYCITNCIAKNTTEAAAIDDGQDCVVKGGGYQEMEASGVGTCTFELEGTVSDMRYFVYDRVKGTLSTITLTYNKQ